MHWFASQMSLVTRGLELGAWNSQSMFLNSWWESTYLKDHVVSARACVSRMLELRQTQTQTLWDARQTPQPTSHMPGQMPSPAGSYRDAEDDEATVPGLPCCRCTVCCDSCVHLHMPCRFHWKCRGFYRIHICLRDWTRHWAIGLQYSKRILIVFYSSIYLSI